MDTDFKIRSLQEKRASPFILTAVIGILVAGGTFFAAFITSQKASTPHPRQNLKLPLIVPPSPAAMVPLSEERPNLRKSSAVPTASIISTPSAEEIVPGTQSAVETLP